jgi:trk system potassium uptake protein TrkA
MHVVIAGCGRVGSDLALRLSADEIDVAVIDEAPERLARLGGAFNGQTEVGSAYDVEVLRRSGIERAEAFVAVTRSDNANVMAAQVAMRVFDVPRTIARLDDPGRAESYDILGVEYVAGAHMVSAVLYEQIVESEFDYHVTFNDPYTDIAIVELHLGSEADGIAVSDLEVKERLRVSAVTRNGTTFIPGPDTVLHTDDMLVAAARHGVMGKVKRYLVDKKPPLA